MAVHKIPRLRWPVIGLTGAAALLLAGFVTWGRLQPPGHNASTLHGGRVDRVDEGHSSLVLVVSGDTAGWIVPCGCASNQSGGLPRRGSFVADRGRNGAVILADAGGAPGGASDYDRCKFEFIVSGEIAMGLAAHNLGGPEISLGVDYLRQLSRDRKFPLISANLKDRAGRAVAEAFRIVDSAGRRVALVGVVSPRFRTPECRIDEPREAVLATLSTMAEKYDALVVLAYLPEEELRELAAGLPEADAIIGGPTTQSIPPAAIGSRVLASATNKGKFLVELEVPSARGASAWSGRVVEMTDAYRDDPAQEKNLRAFYAELERRDFSAEQTAFVVAMSRQTPHEFGVAGSESCVKCHQADCDVWKDSPHAHAWTTLTGRGAHVDAQCQRCHTTGFGLPGGFESVRRSAQRVAVGCESCHGPSREHVRMPSVHTAFVAKDQCVRCHDRENSPQFEYASYWEKVRHGARAGSPATDTIQQLPDAEGTR